MMLFSPHPTWTFNTPHWPSSLEVFSLGLSRSSKRETLKDHQPTWYKLAPVWYLMAAINFKVSFLCLWPVVSGWQLGTDAVMIDSGSAFHTLWFTHSQRCLWALRKAASRHWKKTLPSRSIMILMSVIGQGSINDNNLGKSHLASFPACLPCVALTGSSKNSFASVPQSLSQVALLQIGVLSFILDSLWSPGSILDLLWSRLSSLLLEWALKSKAQTINSALWV